MSEHRRNGAVNGDGKEFEGVFEIEYGTGGVLVNDDEWQIETHNAQSLCGDKPPDKPLRPGILRPVNS